MSSLYRKYARMRLDIMPTLASSIQLQIPESIRMHANNVCHFAIHVDNVERAKLFYQRVFGWRFEEWGPPDFYLIETGNDESPGILGALQKRTEPRGTGFSGYECSISVKDVLKIEASIVECGGRILMKPVEIPTVGVLIKFADTDGNVACAIQYFSRA